MFRANKNLLRSSCLTVLLITPSEPVDASEWIFKKEDKAFGDVDATAMAIGDTSIAFVRCSGGELSVAVATPEDWKESSSAMNALGPKLIMAIDGSEPFTYTATLGENGAHKFLASIEEEASTREAIEKMIAAKKKIEIGIEIGGKRFYASKLSAAGASKKFQAVLDTCASKAKTETKTLEKK